EPATERNHVRYRLCGQGLSRDGRRGRHGGGAVRQVLGVGCQVLGPPCPTPDTQHRTPCITVVPTAHRFAMCATSVPIAPSRSSRRPNGTLPQSHVYTGTRGRPSAPPPSAPLALPLPLPLPLTFPRTPPKPSS